MSKNCNFNKIFNSLFLKAIFSLRSKNMSPSTTPFCALPLHTFFSHNFYFFFIFISMQDEKKPERDSTANLFPWDWSKICELEFCFWKVLFRRSKKVFWLWKNALNRFVYICYLLQIRMSFSVGYYSLIVATIFHKSKTDPSAFQLRQKK